MHYNSEACELEVRWGASRPMAPTQRGRTLRWVTDPPPRKDVGVNHGVGKAVPGKHVSGIVRTRDVLRPRPSAEARKGGMRL